MVREHAKKVPYTNTHESCHISMSVDMQQHTGECRNKALKPPQTHSDTSKWHLKYAYMHMLEGKFQGAQMRAETHKQAETHAVICCPCCFSALPFMFKA